MTRSATISALAATLVFAAFSGVAQEIKTSGATAAHASYVLDGTLVKPDANGEFSPRLIATTQDGDFDMWLKIPAGATPQISSTNKTVSGEKFSLVVLIKNAAVKDGKYKVSYTITAKSPAGEDLTIVKSATLEGEKPARADTLASPDVIGLQFDKTYQTGKYAFSISATDLLADKTVSETITVEIVDWVAPKPIETEELLNQAFYTYYIKPSPELLYSMFFSKKLNLEQKSAPYELNFIMLGFFKAAFAKFDFLIDEILPNFDKFDPLDKSKIILINRLIGRPPIKGGMLTPNQIKYQNSLRNAEFPSAYESWHKIMGTSQLDMLTGEFYATGAYRPVRRMMNLFVNRKESDFTVKTLESGKRPASGDWNKFNIGMLHILAVKAVLRLSQENDLADQYCVWAVENKDLPPESMEIARKFFSVH